MKKTFNVLKIMKINIDTSNFRHWLTFPLLVLMYCILFLATWISGEKKITVNLK